MIEGLLSPNVEIRRGVCGLFHYRGVGKDWEHCNTNPRACLAYHDVNPLPEHSPDCLSSSALPAQHGRHRLQDCNTT